jgi:hypothetical protein
VAAVVAAFIGLTIAAVAGFQIIRELSRQPTEAERDKAAIEEVARRWQSWPAGKIFPATLRYTLDVGGAEKARRVGIDPGGSACGTAIEPKQAAILRDFGCRGVLRATYLDQLQGMAITLGVVVFPDERAAVLAKIKLPKSPGLRTLALPRSVAVRFTDAARQTTASRQTGPYIVLATIGYADGRPASKAKQKQTDLYTVAPQLAEAVLTPLTARSRVECGQRAWSC